MNTKQKTLLISLTVRGDHEALTDFYNQQALGTTLMVQAKGLETADCYPYWPLHPFSVKGSTVTYLMSCAGVSRKLVRITKHSFEKFAAKWNRRCPKVRLDVAEISDSEVPSALDHESIAQP